MSKLKYILSVILFFSVLISEGQQDLFKYKIAYNTGLNIDNYSSFMKSSQTLQEFSIGCIWKNNIGVNLNLEYLNSYFDHNRLYQSLNLTYFFDNDIFFSKNSFLAPFISLEATFHNQGFNETNKLISEKFIYGADAGLKFRFNNRININLTYDYTFPNSKKRFKHSYLNDKFSLGVAYSFGSRINEFKTLKLMVNKDFNTINYQILSDTLYEAFTDTSILQLINNDSLDVYDSLYYKNLIDELIFNVEDSVTFQNNNTTKTDSLIFKENHSDTIVLNEIDIKSHQDTIEESIHLSNDSISLKVRNIRISRENGNIMFEVDSGEAVNIIIDKDAFTYNTNTPLPSTGNDSRLDMKKLLKELSELQNKMNDIQAEIKSVQKEKSNTVSERKFDDTLRYYNYQFSDYPNYNKDETLLLEQKLDSIISMLNINYQVENTITKTDTVFIEIPTKNQSDIKNQTVNSNNYNDSIRFLKLKEEYNLELNNKVINSLRDSLKRIRNENSILKENLIEKSTDQKKSIIIIMFNSNVYTLNSEQEKTLNSVALELAGNPNLSVSVSGYTDKSGNEDINLKISKKRAETVADYLIKNKANKNQIIIQYFGEKFASDSINPNDRKVEIEFVKSKTH